ncbi:AI-2E family transporter [Propioniciclava sp.]|uniref:AI-2E family transporter n=1 Tax=Propioniciclava sp. TaxID=2038686 RepID=UPI00261DEB7E|nr:AI-2E family transporter [Propioniciclava sp.]
MSIFSALGRLIAGPPPSPSTPPPAPVPVIVTTPVEPQVAPVPLEPHVPAGLTIAAGYVLRLLILGVGVVGAYWVLGFFSAITVPFAIAVLLTAMFHPLTDLLKRWGWKPALAAITSLLVMVLVVAGLMVFVGQQVANEWPSLVQQASAGFQTFLAWIATLPFGINATQLLTWFNQGVAWLQTQASSVASTAVEVGGVFGSFFAGLATALVVMFFLSYQGRQIFTGTVDVLIPRPYREVTDRAALRGWTSLTAYMRSAVIVAAVDAAGVALAAFLLDVPLVAALFALTFFLSFIPIVGAVTAGTVAVALALVTHGWVQAVIMLGAVIVVMQLESTFLQPLVMGKAVDLHPLAVLLGIIAGGVVTGILGALLAIPILAFTVAFLRALRHPEERANPTE